MRTYITVMIAIILLLLSATSYHGLCSAYDLDEPARVKSAFVEAFNRSDTEGLYALCNESMRKRTAQSLIQKNLIQIHSQIGPIKSMELIDTTSTSYVYRSVHRLASLKVIFDIDASCFISAMSIEAYTYDDVPALPRNKSLLTLPFYGEWYVFWGGQSLKDNYHNAYPGMKGAYDFWVMGDNGKSSIDNPRVNEDFYAFGKEILAPTAGKVILVNDGIKDNRWPAMNKQASFGNFVMLETAAKEYLLFAHLKLHSITVAEGEVVSAGAVLGRCGNSGNSTEPHLHLQMQNVPDLVSAKSTHIYFNNILVNGVIKHDHIPSKGEKVSNVNE